MQYTTVRSKEKDYDIYLMSEKLVHSQVRARKKCFPSILKWINQIIAILSLTNTVAGILREEKSGSLLFGDQKMQFTTVRSKVKDYNIYLKSEKLVNSKQEPEKNVSQLFGSGKNWFQAISNQINTVATIWREIIKWIPAIWSLKKCSSQLLGTRKKIMTSI